MVRNELVLVKGPECDASCLSDEIEMASHLYADLKCVAPLQPQSAPWDHRIEVDLPIKWPAHTKSDAEVHRSRRIRLRVSVHIMYGYPYAAPRVSVAFVEVDDETKSASTAVDDAFIAATWPSMDSAFALLRRQLSEELWALSSAGHPCLIQALGTVEQFLDRPPNAAAPTALRQLMTNPPMGGDGTPSQTPLSRGATAPATPSAHAAGHGNSNAAPKSVSIMESSSEQAAPAAAAEEVKRLIKQTRLLGTLTLHLASKWLAMQCKDSMAEAKDNFDYLLTYFTDTIHVVPHEISRNWNGVKTLRAAFQSSMEAAAATADSSRECLRWLWEPTAFSSPSTADAFNSHGAFSNSAVLGDISRFSHDFIQQQRIGSGGFAPVYVCRKKVDGRLYAIKKVVIRTEQASRALREVQTLAALEHENIVRYYDAWLEPRVDPDLTDFADDMLAEENDSDNEEDDMEKDSSALLEETDEEAEESLQSSSNGSRHNEHLPPPLAAFRGKESAVGKSGAAAFYVSDEESEEGEDDADDLPRYNTSSTSSSSSEEEEDAISTKAASRRVASSGCCSSSATTPKCSPALPPTKQKPQPVRLQTLYIQMELCSASTLRHLLDSGRLAEPHGELLAASILRQLLTVISHVHSEHIVHRDLKPDNVLFQQSRAPNNAVVSGHRHNPSRVEDMDFGVIKVVDFGLARTMPTSLHRSRSAELDGLFIDSERSPHAAGSFTAPTLGTPSSGQTHHFVTTNCGTVIYCAPEQANGTSYDMKVDEFSVGMIALEMWLAVAGKDYRERYAILSSVSSAIAAARSSSGVGGHGKGVASSSSFLPPWFVSWNQRIAAIIDALICADARQRSTCETILSSSELPGEAPEVTAALETLEQHAPRLIGRVFQRLLDFEVKSFRRRPTALSLSNACSMESVELFRQLELVAKLHSAASLPYFDPLIPMGPTLRHVDSHVLIDDAGRCYLLPTKPHLSVAAFLASQRQKVHENMFSFTYNGKQSGRPLFGVGCLQSPTCFDWHIQPVLYLLQVLGSLELSATLPDAEELSTSRVPFSNGGSSSGGGGAALQIVVTYLPRRLEDSMSEVAPSSSSIGASSDHETLRAESPSENVGESAAPLDHDHDQLPLCSRVRSVDELFHLLQTVHTAEHHLCAEDEQCVIDVVTSTLSAIPHLFRSGKAPDIYLRRGTYHEPLCHPHSLLDAEFVIAAQKGVVVEVGLGPLASAAGSAGVVKRGSVAPGAHHAAAQRTPIAFPFAVVCPLLGFSSQFPHHAVDAFVATIDVAALQMATKRVVRSVMPAMILEAVAVCRTGGNEGGGSVGFVGTYLRTTDGITSSTTCSNSQHADAFANAILMESAIRLLAAGQRVYLRSRFPLKDPQGFRDALVSRHCNWWLTCEPLKLCLVPSLTGKPIRFDVSQENLPSDVRSLVVLHGRGGGSSTAGQAGCVSGSTGVLQASSTNVSAPPTGGSVASSFGPQSPHNLRIEFVGREDSNAVQDARELYGLMLHPLPASILVINALSLEVRYCFLEYCRELQQDDDAPIAPGGATGGGAMMVNAHNRNMPGLHAFGDWLRRHFARHTATVLPVYCLVDKRMEFLPNHHRVKTLNKAAASVSSSVSGNGKGKGGGKHHTSKR